MPRLRRPHMPRRVQAEQVVVHRLGRRRAQLVGEHAIAVQLGDQLRGREPAIATNADADAAADAAAASCRRLLHLAQDLALALEPVGDVRGDDLCHTRCTR